MWFSSSSVWFAQRWAQKSWPDLSALKGQLKLSDFFSTSWTHKTLKHFYMVKVPSWLAKMPVSVPPHALWLTWVIFKNTFKSFTISHSFYFYFFPMLKIISFSVFGKQNLKTYTYVFLSCLCYAIAKYFFYFWTKLIEHTSNYEKRSVYVTFYS